LPPHRRHPSTKYTLSMSRWRRRITLVEGGREAVSLSATRPRDLDGQPAAVAFPFLREGTGGGAKTLVQAPPRGEGSTLTLGDATTRSCWTGGSCRLFFCARGQAVVQGLHCEHRLGGRGLPPKLKATKAEVIALKIRVSQFFFSLPLLKQQGKLDHSNLERNMIFFFCWPSIYLSLSLSAHEKTFRVSLFRNAEMFAFGAVVDNATKFNSRRESSLSRRHDGGGEERCTHAIAGKKKRFRRGTLRSRVGIPPPLYKKTPEEGESERSDAPPASWDFFLLKNKKKKGWVMEKTGIDPATSSMRSKRSTI
jgi:hypothetical protein